jgi:hypothetical protein
LHLRFTGSITFLTAFSLCIQKDMRMSNENNLTDYNEKVAKAHDHFFRGMLSNKRTAQEFLIEHLPKRLSSRLDWETIESLEDTFIANNLTLTASDILHKVKM